MPDTSPRSIAFLGAEGSFSHQACREAAPDFTARAYPTFQEILTAVREGEVEAAMVPIDNSRAGRVGDVYHLLPDAGVHITAEHFLVVRNNLLGRPGARREDIHTVTSHPMALAQCRKVLGEMGVTQMPAHDTASAAMAVIEKEDTGLAAVGSRVAAERYGLEILQADIQDSHDNVTRFLRLERDLIESPAGEGPFLTTVLFEVRSIPSALFKVLGGFATNGINLTKLESYFVGDRFTVAKFYCDFEGIPTDPSVKRALEEVRFFCRSFDLLGVYPASPYRLAEEEG